MLRDAREPERRIGESRQDRELHTYRPDGKQVEERCKFHLELACRKAVEVNSVVMNTVWRQKFQATDEILRIGSADENAPVFQRSAHRIVKLPPPLGSRKVLQDLARQGAVATFRAQPNACRVGEHQAEPCRSLDTAGKDVK